MSKIKITPLVINGKEAIITHDKLCADGPFDPITKEQLIDENTGNPYPGKNDDMAEQLVNYCSIIRSQNKPNLDFGILSLVASITPIFAYDHPAFTDLNEKGFTDGKHVFINADYMRRVIKEEPYESNPNGGLVLFILQKLMERIELTLTKNELTFFEEKLLKKVNLTPVLISNPNDINNNINNDINNNINNDINTIKLEKVIETLETNGLESVINALYLPNSNDLNAIEKLKNKVHKNTIDAIEDNYNVSFTPVNTGNTIEINPIEQISKDITSKKIQKMKDSLNNTPLLIQSHKIK